MSAHLSNCYSKQPSIRVRLSPMRSVEGQSEQDVHFSCNSKFQFHISGGKKRKKKSYLLLFLVAQSERLTSRTAKEIQASTRSTQLAFFMKKELRSCLTARKCQLASMFARICIVESCLKWLLFVEQLMIQQGRLNKTTGNQGNVRFLHLDSTSTGYGDGEQSSTATSWRYENESISKYWFSSLVKHHVSFRFCVWCPSVYKKLESRWRSCNKQHQPAKILATTSLNICLMNISNPPDCLAQNTFKFSFTSNNQQTNLCCFHWLADNPVSWKTVET